MARMIIAPTTARGRFVAETRPDAAESALAPANGFTDAMRPLIAAIDRDHRNLLHDASPDCVHALRGALRRARAALLLFDDLLAPGDATWLRHELKRYARKLGATRDLDVLIGWSKTHPPGYHPEARFEDLLPSAAEQARQAAVGGALGAARSARATLLVEGLEEWVRCSGARLALGDDPAVGRRIEAWVAAADTKVRKQGANVGKLGASSRHRLRGRLKTLRYNYELQRRLDGQSGNPKYLACLTDLHRILGDLHDLEVGSRLTAKLLEPKGRIAFAAIRAAQAAGLRRSLKSAWIAFGASRPAEQATAPYPRRELKPLLPLHVP
jgi:CHAD domain-containing protein